ncbi:phage regulatory CII family protein [Aquabacterium sp.]|uniref:phage regulatory CII family protein n=1 Tax=Aquabacterium sp. TaxID=1872578 RepID=UPI0025BCB2C8|nr:phage regulatory CII family protein [Aquabacterium sp.]
MSNKLAAGAPIPANPQDAFHDAVHGYGVKALAALLVMKPGTLYNKCDADDDSHNQPTLRDIVRVTRATGNMVILDSLDRMFNRAAYDLTPCLQISDEALLELLCKVNSENGAMHAALTKGLADGKFTQTEMRAVRGEAFELITAVLTFLQRLEGLVDD